MAEMSKPLQVAWGCWSAMEVRKIPVPVPRSATAKVSPLLGRGIGTEGWMRKDRAVVMWLNWMFRLLCWRKWR